MRKKQQDQLPLVMSEMDHSGTEELKRISQIMDQHPIISEMVWQDLA
ncbi:MAG: hypothetical protein JXL84_14915 [Deltaproteobacteria bacterium]|nr:hypothetical protein [Deltaproteobacteria bacterium]